MIGSWGARRVIGNRVNDLDALHRLLAGGSTLAWHRPGIGVTGALNATAWETQLGSFGPLLETGGSGPIYNAWTGPNYLGLYGLDNNHASCASNAALQAITGDMAVVVYSAQNDYTPAANTDLASKDAGTSWHLFIDTGGKIRFDIGATTHVSTAACGVTDATAQYIAATLDADNGAAGHDVKFLKSADGLTYSQIGNTVTTAGTITITQNANPVLIGGRVATGTGSGKFYRAQVYNGMPVFLGGAGGTLAMDANFTLVAEGATSFAESSVNAATVTMVQNGATPAQIVGSPSMLFNGTTHTLLVAASVQAQPFTWYFTGTQITRTAGATIIGDRLNDLGLLQQGLTPNIGLGNTANDPTIDGPALGTKFVACAVWNGAASSVRLNMGAETIGNPGAGAMARFSVAARAGNISGNIQVNEIILRAGADSPVTQFDIIRREMALHKIAE